MALVVVGQEDPLANGLADTLKREGMAISENTKLREGNVFICVCLSFCSKGNSHGTITHDALDLTVQPPPHIRHLTHPQE